MVLAIAATAGCPGWLGVGFLYQPPSHGKRPTDGWMYVQRLDAHGPAAAAGLRPGDIVTAIDAEPLRYGDERALLARLSRIRPHEQVKVDVRRGAHAFAAVIVAVPSTQERCRAWRANFPR
jgi:S1-C subfamily serine protease